MARKSKKQRRRIVGTQWYALVEETPSIPDYTAPCSKCGGGPGTNMEWCLSSLYGEVLAKTCAVCGYKWLSRCADYK